MHRLLVFALLLVMTAAMLGGGRLPAAYAEGIGIFPSIVQVDGALRGAVSFQDIGVVNDSDKERNFRFQAGGEIQSWLTFVDLEDRNKVIESIDIPRNSNGHALVKVAVPAEQANGTYKGFVRTLTSPKPEELNGASGATINLGAEASVVVSVTGTQRLAGSIVDVQVSETEVGTPLRIRAVLKNASNVAVKPQINLVLDQGAFLQETKVSVPTSATVLPRTAASILGPTTYPTDDIFPDETKAVVAEVPTDNIPPGSYTARVSITLLSLPIGDTTLPVSVLPRGALSRQGELTNLRLQNAPEPGGVAKVQATIVNTGQIDSRAIFVGELYRGDTLVNAVQGIEKLVYKGEQQSLDVFVQVQEKGHYVLRGRVSFEGKDTEERELSFGVGQSGGIASSDMLVKGGAGVLALGVVGGLAYFFKLRQRPRVA